MKGNDNQNHNAHVYYKVCFGLPPVLPFKRVIQSFIRVSVDPVCSYRNRLQYAVHSSA